jgi:hypothetical protein
MVWNELVGQYVTEEEDRQITSEEENFSNPFDASWEIDFKLDFARRSIRFPIQDSSRQYPFKDILSIRRGWRSRFDEYVLRQPKLEDPIFPDNAPQPLWEFITSMKSRILSITEIETRRTLSWLQSTGTVLGTTPTFHTQTRINRLSRCRELEFEQYHLDGVFDHEDALFDYVTKLVAAVIIETRATVWFFGGESKLFHHSGRIGGNSVTRQQCACHLIVLYNQYIHHRAQSGFQDGFGWAHGTLSWSNIGISICTLCKFARFIEGYSFKITEHHDDSLYDDCVCLSLVLPPADII